MEETGVDYASPGRRSIGNTQEKDEKKLNKRGCPFPPLLLFFSCLHMSNCTFPVWLKRDRNLCYTNSFFSWYILNCLVLPCLGLFSKGHWTIIPKSFFGHSNKSDPCFLGKFFNWPILFHISPEQSKPKSSLLSVYQEQSPLALS